MDAAPCRLDGRSISTALIDTDDTRLGRAIAPRVAAHPGKTGVHPLLDSRDAFAARVLLARAAYATEEIVFVDLDVMAVGPRS